jgi:hypothetical protein
MRRSGYLCCLLATFLVSSQPDAAYVPAKRSVAAANPRVTPTVPRIASSPSLVTALPLAAAPRAAAMAMLESSNPAGAVLTLTSLSFVGGDSTKSTQFDPQPVASTAVSIVRFVAGTTPAGFTPASTLQQITVTINP